MMSKKDKERAKRVQAICAEIRNTVFDNDGNAVGRYSDKNIIFDETGTYPIGKKLKDGSIMYFNTYKGKEKHEIREDKDMENYIVINGKRAELTDEQLEKLGLKPENKNKYAEMFERRKEGEFYFIIGRTGKVATTSEIKAQEDEQFFECANYCRNMEVMKQRALHETLNRLLWRASIIAGELENPWDGYTYHYYIYYDTELETLRIQSNYTCQIQGICYFPSEESAKEAIENIIKPFLKEHPDFVW